MYTHILELLKQDPSKYPRALKQQFPSVLEKIIELWDTPAMETFFYELMVDTRGGIRRGFPPNVALEIFNLHKIYTLQNPEEKKLINVWAHISIRKQQEIELLGFDCTEAGFLAAIEQGNEAAVTLFLACGIEVDTRDERDWTPLMIASFNGDEKLALLLIRCGAKIQAMDKNGYTPLHWGAFNGYANVVELLIEKDARINARSQFGWTALMQAATRGHIEVVKKLLENNAWVNEITCDGWTALHKAAANGHVEIVLLLLEKGADSAIAYPDGSTAMSLASKNNHKDIVCVLRRFPPQIGR